MPKNKLILVVNSLLILATLTAYSQVGNHGFVNFDDDIYITQNPSIHDGITVQGLYWAFTTGHAANWHPLTWMSHMLDIQIFGLNPRGHHLTNLLFHVANVLLLFFVLNNMTKALWRSAFVAALFALHPLHVESVAWISERKDVLSTFFWMLTLVAYNRYAGTPRLRNYLAVIAVFALGLMAKPMLVTLPFVLVLLDYWPLRRFAGSKAAQSIPAAAQNCVPATRRKRKAGKPAPATGIEAPNPAAAAFHRPAGRPLVVEKIPLLVLAAFSCAATYIAQNKGGTVASTEVFTLGLRLTNAFVSYVIYIVKTVWPENLAVFYPHPGFLPLWRILGAALFLIVVTFSVILKGRRFPYLPVGWLWFTGTLVPVIGVVQVGTQALADRYTYIPSIGLFIMAAWGIPEIFRQRSHAKNILAACAALCLLCLAILTRTQVGYWRDNISLFDHAVNVTTNNGAMYNNRGNALHSVGKNDQAIRDFDRAIEITPRFAEAYNGRGLARKSMGDYVRAVEDFDKAIEINPSFVEAYNNRGLTRNIVGNYSQAVEDFDRAIQINPEMAPVYNNRGNARDCMGDHARAIEDYDRAIAINPQYADAFNNRGIAYDGMDNHMQAIEDFNRAIAINPDYAEAYYNRGSVQASLGNEEQAIQDMKTAAGLGFERAGDFLKQRKVD